MTTTWNEARSDGLLDEAVSIDAGALGGVGLDGFPADGVRVEAVVIGRVGIDGVGIDGVGIDAAGADASPQRTLTALAIDLDRAHSSGVMAASAGLQDPALGATRLTGNAVETLAEAAVSSATPFLRAPLLSRLSRVLQLHPRSGRDDGRCPACGVPAPCDTALELRW